MAGALLNVIAVDEYSPESEFTERAFVNAGSYPRKNGSRTVKLQTGAFYSHVMHLARLQLPGRSATISRGIDSLLLSFVHGIAEQAKRVSARTRACTRVHARVTSVTSTRGSPLG